MTLVTRFVIFVTGACILWAVLAITFIAVSEHKQGEECLRAGGVIATIKGSYDYTEKPICIEKPKRIPL